MGVYTFTFPADFKREFTKEYSVSGSTFEIDVAYLGILPKQFAGAVACHMWAYQIFVKGNKIMEAPYYWGVDKRELSLENVANHLASYWGHDQTIADAQELAGSPLWELDRIVEKCAAWMNGYLVGEDRDHTDYDIQVQALFEGGWTVILRPNYMPNRLFQFYKTDEMENVEIRTYIEDNELSVKL